nr:hypothetical protein CFP56_75594 [Quercus suber]
MPHGNGPRDYANECQLHEHWTDSKCAIFGRCGSLLVTFDLAGQNNRRHDQLHSDSAASISMLSASSTDMSVPFHIFEPVTILRLQFKSHVCP